MRPGQLDPNEFELAILERIAASAQKREVMPLRSSFI
jgi:hypothetical protein